MLSHQQRQGQFLYNALRPDKDGERTIQDLDKYKAQIADALWNLTDKEFMKIMQRFFQ